MGYPVVHFEVVGKDTKALRDFYANAFEWKVEQMPSVGGIDYAMAYSEAGRGIDGGIGAGMDETQSYVSFYIEVPDIEAMLSKILSLGGSTVMPAMQVPGGPLIAMITDPGDHLIGLVQAGGRA